MGSVFAAIGYTVSMAFALFWQIFWALNLGSLLSGIVRAGVPKSAITKLLPDDSGRSITIDYEILVTTCRFVAIISIVCSVGNVPLDAVLWDGGSSFGGVKILRLSIASCIRCAHGRTQPFASALFRRCS